MTKPGSSTNQQTAPYLCEYSRQPFDDCYCRKVTGRTVPNIALYCMERYGECPIYCKRVKQYATCPDAPNNSQEV